jgi:hypothetical protein
LGRENDGSAKAGFAAGLGAAGLATGFAGAGLGATLGAGLAAGLASGADFLPVSQSGAVKNGLPCDGARGAAGDEDSGLRTLPVPRFTVPPGSCTRATGAARTLAARPAATGTGITP